MSNILISPPPTTLLTGLLQLDGGVAISSTPVYVTDQNNTASKLSLGTNNVGINTTSTFARLTIANTNTLASEYLLSASTSTASFYVRNDGYLYNAERGRISNILIAQQGTNSLSSTLSGGSGGCLWLGTNGTAITNTTNLTPTAMAHIKGSGSTSATTTMLLQNSGASQIMLVRDDGNIGIGSVATSPAYQMTQARYGIPTYFLVNTSLQDAGTVGQVVGNLQFGFYPNSTTTSHGAIKCITDGSWASGSLAFFTQGGDGTVSLATEKMRLSPAGNLGIGITAPTSRLHIKGSGTTSATTALIVDKSDGNTSFLVRDDAQSIFYGGVAMNFYNASQYLNIKGSGTTSATTNTNITNSSGTQLVKVTDDGKVTIGNGTTGTALLDVSVGSGSTPPLRLKGYSDAGTSYLISAGTESFADNFKIKMVNGNVTMGTQLNGYTFGLETFNGTALQIFNSGNISIGNTTESAKLFVKGSGTTSATSSFLVQNNSGTQVLKAFDDTSVEIGNQASSTAGKITVTPTDSNYYFAFGWHFFGSKNYYQMNIYGNTDSSVGVAIGKGTTSAVNSSILELSSSTKGFLPPRMTTAQKLLIGTPASGLMVYDTSLNQMSYYNGTTWINF